MSDERANGNGGYVRWSDLREHERTESKARHELGDRMAVQLGEMRSETQGRFRDHERRMVSHEERTDRIESILDQLRGAQFMLKIIFGTSIIGIILAGVSIVVALR